MSLRKAIVKPSLFYAGILRGACTKLRTPDNTGEKEEER